MAAWQAALVQLVLTQAVVAAATSPVHCGVIRRSTTFPQ